MSHRTTRKSPSRSPRQQQQHRPTSPSSTSSLIISSTQSLLTTISHQKRQIAQLQSDILARDYIIENLRRELKRERVQRVERMAGFGMETVKRVIRDEVRHVEEELERSREERTPGKGTNVPGTQIASEAAPKAPKSVAMSTVTRTTARTRMAPNAKDSSIKGQHPYHTPNRKEEELLDAVQRHNRLHTHQASPMATRGIALRHFKWTTVREGHVELERDDIGAKSIKSFGSALAKDYHIDPRQDSCKFAIRIVHIPEGSEGADAHGNDAENYILVGVADANAFSVNDACGMNEYSWGIDTCYGQRWKEGISGSFYNAPIVAGDVVTLILHKGRMMVEINGEYVGVAFKKIHATVCPCVTFLGEGYEVEVIQSQEELEKATEGRGKTRMGQFTEDLLGNVEYVDEELVPVKDTTKTKTPTNKRSAPPSAVTISDDFSTENLDLTQLDKDFLEDFENS